MLTPQQAYDLINAAIATLKVVNSGSNWNVQDVIDAADSAAAEIKTAWGTK